MIENSDCKTDFETVLSNLLSPHLSHADGEAGGWTGERLKLDGRCLFSAVSDFTAALYPLFLHHDRGPAACESMNDQISHFTDAERTQCLSW